MLSGIKKKKKGKFYYKITQHRVAFASPTIFSDVLPMNFLGDSIELCSELDEVMEPEPLSGELTRLIARARFSSARVPALIVTET